jgi:hypothetical protein
MMVGGIGRRRLGFSGSGGAQRVATVASTMAGAVTADAFQRVSTVSNPMVCKASETTADDPLFEEVH